MPLYRLDQLQPFQAINLLTDPGAIGGPVVVPSCTQVVITWNLTNGRQGKNVMYGRYSGAFSLTPANATSFMTTLTTGANWTALAAHLASTASLASVSFRDVNTPNNGYVTSTGSAAPGTSSGTAVPDEVAAVITLRTAKTGQSNRGRIYVPGWATTALAAGGVMAAAAVTALTNWANGPLAAAFGPIGLVHVLGQPARQAYTGATGTDHPARAATSTAVTGYVIRDNHWDSMRRRGLK